MKEEISQEVEIKETTIKQVMNCPFAAPATGLRNDQPVIEKTCDGCLLCNRKGGCAFIKADLMTVRTAVFDEESKTPWYVWRFNCAHCQHPVSMITLKQNLLSGVYGRCNQCGAFHYYLGAEYPIDPKNIKWWYAVSEPDGRMGRINTRSSVLDFQARIPDRLKGKD